MISSQSYTHLLQETREKFCNVALGILQEDRVNLPVERSMLAMVFKGFRKENAHEISSESRMFKLLATAIRTDWMGHHIPLDVESPLIMVLHQVG